MSSYWRRNIAGCVAGLWLAAGLSTASASTLSISRTSASFRWPQLGFVSASGAEITCRVTLSASFHEASIAKVSQMLIGIIESATFSSCTGGGVTLLTATLPWHLTYRSFTGTLPRITSVLVDVVGMSYKYKPTEAMASCLSITTTERPLLLVVSIEVSHRVTGVAAGELEIPLAGFLCEWGTEGHFEGASDESTITVSLI